MKNVYIVLILFFCFNNTIAQEYYYWANDQKYPLELYADKQYVVIEDKHKESFAQSLGIQEQEVSGLTLLTISKTVHYVNANNTLDDENLHWGFVNRTLSKETIRSSVIIYAAPSFLVNGNEVGLSQFFYVKIKQKQDIDILKDLARKNKVEIVGNDSFMPLWYIMSCDKNSKGNALEMANLFYETGNFPSAQPDFLVDYGANCRNDPFFNQQWHLNNTGQFGGTVGNDTRICQTWDITMGCADVVVAVLDHGLEFNHPDFNNISPISFDSETGTQPSVVRGNHGVAVAGIIGASTNNGLGVAGIAPNVQLMSISNSLELAPLVSQRLSNGINFAWQNGADVINNSWGHNDLPDQDLIEDAINNAVTQGRGGLGSIVVFATGNENNNTIGFPSNNPQVIAVGAMSMCNQRKSPTSCDGEITWGSNFGAGLDVMAPGVLISTTDRQGNLGYNPNFAIHPNNGGTLVANDYADQNYTTWFNGTSAAAPQVAGIAALILSVNPNLTLQQVRNIIESTTDKIGNYTYTPGAGEQASLTWNSEMGYGRVNAHAAVQAALPPISGPPDPVCPTSLYSIPNLPAGSTVAWSASPVGMVSLSPSGNTVTVTRLSGQNGFVTLAAEITYPSCGSVTSERRIIAGISPALIERIDGPYEFPVNTSNNFSIDIIPTITNYQWSVFPSGYEWIGNQGTNGINLSISSPGLYSLGVDITNPCGTAGVETSIYVSGPFDHFNVYPNPVSENLTVENTAAEGMQSEQAGFEVSLYDRAGKELMNFPRTTEPFISINVRPLKNGFYYLHIRYKEALIRKQIRVER